MGKNESLWDNIKIEHVNEAIESYEFGSDKSNVQYYIIANGKKYPARIIRRMAFEFANGKACDSKEINGKGGANAKRFFEGLPGFKESGYICVNQSNCEMLDNIWSSETDSLLDEI